MINDLKQKMRPAVFFDRDGVLNINTHYTHKPEDFQWIEGAKEAVKFVNEAGYLAFVVTNQSGIGRGYYSEEQFHALMDWAAENLAQAGAHWDGVYFCPNHPLYGIGEYKVECASRNPKPGMILQAAEECAVDLSHSFMIGDSESDRGAAQAAGIAYHHFTGGRLDDLVKSILGSDYQ